VRPDGRAIIRNIRSISESVYLVVRTRYVKETSELIALGADEVIPEEYETSIQIFSRVLQNFLIPENQIERIIENIRTDDYELFKNENKRRKTFKPAKFPDFNITCLRIGADSGKFLGKPIRDLDLRSEFRINILGIARNDNLLEGIQPEDTLKQDDVLYIQGNPKDIEDFYKLIK
jgi:CPA2 family monovalent cation:H+ antiporter-2